MPVPGLAGDISELVEPPQFPKEVRWSDTVASAHAESLDVDGDGTLDLLLFGRGPTIAYLARGRGDGSFDVPTVIHADRLAAVEGAMGLLDVNGDGLGDLVYLSTLSNNDVPRRGRVTALVNQGDGRFEARVSDFDGYAGPFAATDLNADGQLDLIVSCPASNQEARGQTYLFAMIGAGDGTFAITSSAPQRVPSLSTTQLLIAQLHKGQPPALVAAGHDSKGRARMAVFPLASQGVGAAAWSHTLDSTAPRRLLASDLDADAQDELVWFSATERRITTLRFAHDHDSKPLLTEHEVEGDSYALADGIALADLDDDGALDLLIPGSDTRSTGGFRFGPVLMIASGDGMGGFDADRVLQLAARDGEFGAHALATDLNQDGSLDLALGTYGTEGASGRMGVLLGPLTD